jgi:hypothetical protein
MDFMAKIAPRSFIDAKVSRTILRKRISSQTSRRSSKRLLINGLVVTGRVGFGVASAGRSSTLRRGDLKLGMKGLRILEIISTRRRRISPSGFQRTPTALLAISSPRLAMWKSLEATVRYGSNILTKMSL